jgi:RND family efflux transporter MFP subunit
LARIDAPLVALEEKLAQAALRQAEAQAREVQARVATARAFVQVSIADLKQREADLAAAKVDADFCRTELMQVKKAKNAVPQSLVLQKEKRLAVANAQVDSAAAAVQKARADLGVAQAKVRQAEAPLLSAETKRETARIALEKAKYTRGLTRIVSPVDGIVTRRSWLNGQYIRAGEQAGRQPLLTVEQTDRLRVLVDVPDKLVPRTQTGAPAELSFTALPGAAFPALKVSRIGFVEDPATGMMRVEIDVPNPKQLLRPGMRGNATLHLRAPSEALRVKASSVVRVEEDKRAVYVVRDGKARRTPVETGLEDRGQVEILSGLKATDRVVTDPKGLRGEAVPVEVKE